MRKLFLLITAFLLSVAVNADVINITPTSPYDTHDNLRLALYYANSGDEIVLADGTYLEKDNYLYFNKDVTVRAADGASPVIDMYTYAQIKSDANIRIEGLKFNGAAQGEYSYYIRFYDNSNTSLELDGCEFYSVKNYVLYGNSSSHTNSLIVNNCYFHNNVKNAIYFEASGTEGVQTCARLEVRNTTIANTDALTNNTSTIDIRPYGSDVTDAIKVIIDHCTFYNNPTINSDHSAIRPYKLSDVTISNCIFAHPEVYERRATCCYGGTISNCLTFNLTTDASQNAHRQSGGLPAFSGNFTADPLFTDAANGDFSYPGNWSTGNISPARGSASDNSDLGDPRWYTAETLPLPTTNFASPYSFIGTKAQLLGSFALNANDSIQSQDKDYDGIANWKFHAERSCQVQVTLNINANNTSGHRYEVELFDANNVLVGTSIAEAANAWTKGDQILGTLKIPAIGDYKIRLTNHTDHSSTVINGITLSYIGGAIQNISTSTNTTLNVADAWFSGCTRDNEKTYIQYPSSSTSSAWMKWNIATSETKYYDLTVNVNTAYNHGFTVAIYEDEEADPIASVTEGSYVETTGDGLGLEVGRVNLVGGKNYVVKVTNAPPGSQAKVTSVVFAPVAASATELPGTLAFSNAVLSARAHVTDGKLYFAPIGDTNPEGEWARWAVTTDHAGLFLFTMGVNSSNSQSYKISIYNNLDTRIDYYEAKPSSGAQTLKHYFRLPAGNYSVQVENTTEWSNGYLTSLVVTEPSVVTLDESATDNTAWADKVVDKSDEGPLYDVQIIRSFRGGMNNTFCLPFAVSSSQCKEVFGNDVEIYTLGEATIEDYILNLTVNPSSDIYPGTPVLIKPSHDIVNPVFIDVKFTATTASATTKTKADFVGSFVKTPLSANDDLLYVGPENKVFFLSVDYEMPGMRAWFFIHDVPAALGSPKALRSARIIEKEQVTTSILDVETSDDTIRKVLHNGQIVIIRGNEMYNMQGQHIQ